MISKKKLMELYAAMVKCRAAAEFGVVNARPAGDGHAIQKPIDEAVLAGVVVDLERGDTLLHPSLGPGPKRMSTTPLDRLYLALAKNGHERRPQKRTAKPDALKAIGKAARASKEKNSAIAVVFCEGVHSTKAEWKKQLKQASRKNLPLLFVCPEHALHASHRKKIAETEALLHGVPVIVVDGHDVVAVYRVASESIARARQRRGPTVIATTEFTPSKPTRKAAPRNGASPSLVVMETHLKEQGLYGPRKRAGIETTFIGKLKRATRTRTR